MKKEVKTFFTAGVAIMAVLGCGYILLPSSRAEARRILVTDGDIYRVSNVTDAYRFTHSKDMRMLFDERGDDLLVGKGLEGGTDSSSNIDGSRLYIVKNDSGDTVSLSDELVDNAFFDKTGTQVYFVTRNKELRSVTIATKESRLLKEKVFDPKLSPDGKFVVYTKLNPDWVPGEYYDKALGLAVLNLETGQEKLITDSWKDFDASWTPDGSRIIFLSTVTVQDTPATTRKQSLKEYKTIPSAAFHPAGAEFAQKSSSDAIAQPANADGTPREEFTTIAIPATYSTHTTFFSIKPDGTERTQLTTTSELKDKTRKPPVPSSDLSWSKDGKTFVFDSDGSVWTGTVDKNLGRLSSKKIGTGRNPQWDTNTDTITAISSNVDTAIIRMTRDGQVVK